jgi:hypothetical protein
VNIDGTSYDRLELERHNGSLDAAGSVRLVELADGAERGIRVLEFRNATGLAFEVLVDRAMDIGSAAYRGREFAWRSATGFRHPGLHEYADESGLSWLRSFSGLTVTGGLDHTLFTAVTDASHHNYPHRATTWNGLHGRVANIPARLGGYGIEERDGTLVLFAEGDVTQAAIFGEFLRLRRRIECDLDGTMIRLTDTVRNHGFDRQPHMFLYHVNYGWPLLAAGSRFVAPITSTRWHSDSVAEQGVSHLTMPPPQPDFVEQVYEHELAITGGETSAMIVNDELAWAVEMTWNATAFPAFFQWLHLREGAYALGMEPSTNHVEGRLAAEADGSLSWLDHGETRTYATRWTVHDGADAVADAEAVCMRQLG